MFDSYIVAVECVVRILSPTMQGKFYPLEERLFMHWVGSFPWALSKLCMHVCVFVHVCLWPCVGGVIVLKLFVCVCVIV